MTKIYFLTTNVLCAWISALSNRRQHQTVVSLAISLNYYVGRVVELVGHRCRNNVWCSSSLRNTQVIVRIAPESEQIELRPNKRVAPSCSNTFRGNYFITRESIEESDLYRRIVVLYVASAKIAARIVTNSVQSRRIGGGKEQTVLLRRTNEVDSGSARGEMNLGGVRGVHVVSKAQISVQVPSKGIHQSIGGKNSGRISTSGNLLDGVTSGSSENDSGNVAVGTSSNLVVFARAKSPHAGTGHDQGVLEGSGDTNNNFSVQIGDGDLNRENVLVLATCTLPQLTVSVQSVTPNLVVGQKNDGMVSSRESFSNDETVVDKVGYQDKVLVIRGGIDTELSVPIQTSLVHVSNVGDNRRVTRTALDLDNILVGNVGHKSRKFDDARSSYSSNTHTTVAFLTESS